MANPIDFIVKNGLQVSTNLVVGTYSVNANVTPISNGAIISGNVGIGTSIPIPGAMLTVAGNIFVTTGGSVGVGTAIVSSGNAVAIYGGNLFVAGNLTISNTATQLGGIQFADGTFQRSASIIPNPNAANTSNVNITTVSTDAVFYPTFVSAITGNLALYTNAGISVNPATGSLNVGGNLIVSGNLVVDNTYINNIFLSTTDTVIISNSNATTSSTSGALQVLGGGGFGGNLYVAGSSWINNLSVFSSNASTSSKTGALVVAGGAGIGGNLWVNNSINSSNLYASTNFQLGANLTTGTVVWNPTAANPWFGMYTNANSLYYGISSALPSPSGTSTLGGYFKGLGVGGSTNSSGNPIFGVLTSTQGGQGIGSVAFTVYDTNKIQTFYNTIDDGAGNMVTAGYARHSNLSLISTTVSTSATTGALTVAGGAGISSNLNVGGSMSTLAGNVGIGTTGATQVNPFEVWSNNNLHFRVNAVAGVYNNTFVYVRPSGSGGAAQLGSSTGSFLQFVANPYIQLGTGGGAMTATFNTNNSYVNQFVVSGGIANSNAVVVSTTGSDATVSLAIMPQGGANVGIGSSSPIYKLDVAGDIRTTGNIFAANTVGIGTTVMTSGYVLTVNGGIAATTKSFVIPHPTKPNMSLRYASLEGPENGVYLRGKLEGSNIIELPEYWSKLVDVDSITVHLTPVGKYQKLYVAKVTNTRIEIAVDSLFITPAISTFYTVYAERADVPKLLVEV